MWINNIAELPWKYTLYTPELACRKVLEMCCFMQNFLARTLADFEMNLEKEVLVPLNKLSEVVFVLVPNYMNWNRLYSWPIHDRCYAYRRTCQRSWKTRNSLLNLQQTGIMHASGDFCFVLFGHFDQNMLQLLLQCKSHLRIFTILFYEDCVMNIYAICVSLLDLRPAQVHRPSKTDYERM